MCFTFLVACGGGSGDVGRACESNADCDRELCLAITDMRSVCTKTCRTSDDCVAGWTCGPGAGLSGDVCNCAPSAEDCDGVDDDCDGVVDDGIGSAVGCPVGNECVDAACRCAAQNTCGEACVDISSDPANCGGCGVTCTSPNGCAGGACVPPAGITAGYTHTCAWFADGPAYCWGENENQQIALDATSPLPPTLLDVGAVRSVGAGTDLTCVVAVDGNVVCQGGSDSIGVDPPDPSLHRATPISSGDAVGVVAGHGHACAWLLDGRVFCWGGNNQGQLGTGPMGTPLYTPTRVEGLDPVVNMAAGNITTCAVVESGELYCWGRIPGETVTTSVTPVRVDLSPVEHLAVNGQAVAVTGDGSLWAWGDNQNGQAGVEPISPDPVATPTAIPALSGATSVAAHYFQSCAVKAGDALCWGGNASGQLGNGTTVNSYLPVLVSGGHSFRAVTAGLLHTCGIAEEGIFCWGSDQDGRVSGTLGGIELTPIQVPLF